AAVQDLGGDGLVLAKDLGQEYFRYDEAAKALVGDESGETYRVGQRLTLRLAEANPVSGSLRFELPEGSYGGRSAPSRRDRTRRSTTRTSTPARPSNGRAYAIRSELRTGCCSSAPNTTAASPAYSRMPSMSAHAPTARACSTRRRRRSSPRHRGASAASAPTTRSARR